MKKKSLSRQLSYICYRIIRWAVKLFYPTIIVEGLKNLPEGACLLVGNHSKTNGPIISELYIPGLHATWCAGEMMRLREVPDYAYKDFWSLKPRCIRWLYRILSYLIAPLCVCVFNNADTIPVYRDSRIIKTFRESVDVLCNGYRITVFPEQAKAHNHIVNDFQEGFVELARMYHRKTGKSLPFVPVYFAPLMKKIYIGNAVYYNPQADKHDERRRICCELMQRITDIAVALPEHNVIPYLNMPKKDYPKNTIPEEKVYHENSPC